MQQASDFGARRRNAAVVRVVLSFAIAVAALAACGSSAVGPRNGGTIRVVASLNFWGSIAAQVGGSHVSVTSLVTNPATDPHDYEPTAADARAIAGADLVVVNGVGYDAWASALLAASPGRRVLNVGTLVGARDGDNPHLWYSPRDVTAFISGYAKELATIEPTRAADFLSNSRHFETVGLAQYHRLIATIHERYAGTPVGASESIAAMLTPALGLKLLTPPRFLRDISEGNDVSAADTLTIDRQIARREIRIYLFNSQNRTPDVERQLEECRARGIPTTSITETMTPASTTFQSWQSAQLQGIANALANATGR